MKNHKLYGYKHRSSSASPSISPSASPSYGISVTVSCSNEAAGEIRIKASATIKPETAVVQRLLGRDDPEAIARLKADLREDLADQIAEALVNNQDSLLEINRSMLTGEIHARVDLSVEKYIRRYL